MNNTVTISIFLLLLFIAFSIMLLTLIKRREQQRRDALALAEAEKKSKHTFMVMSGLTEDYDLLINVKFKADKKNDIAEIYRFSNAFKERIPGVEAETSFSRILDLIAEYDIAPEGRSDFLAATRREVLTEKLKSAKSYIINFPSADRNSSLFRQMKFVADCDEAGNLIGIITGIRNVDSETSSIFAAQKANDVISVLSSEYNAVYYCHEDTHDYEVLFQQGFVREELDKMQQLCPKYEDAFRFFIKMLVHPEDRESMARELSFVPGQLNHQKSVRIEFRRLYGDKYLYTEMYCVKVGDAEDELHDFVAGFSENDAQYRNTLEQQKQLEHMVTERTAELRSRNRTLNRINEDIIELLGNITEARDANSGEHIRRVKGFTNIIARAVMVNLPEYGLTSDDVSLMTSASALHDIGKITISDAILLKPGKLTAEEFEIMKTHCVNGCEMLKKAPGDWSPSYLKASLDICRHHHERYDGKGYPDGLTGDEIPVSAQIVALADCFDALISKRVYKDAYVYEKAFDMILNGECGAFSQKLLDVFRSCRAEIFHYAADCSLSYDSVMSVGISSASLSNLKILYADDTPLHLEIGSEILQAEGAEVTRVSGGKQALTAFENSPVGFYDAILLDVAMPGMDGMQTAAAIRTLDRSDASSIVIIALASLTSESDINKCLAAGMDSFISKPISSTEFSKVLFECTRSRTEALGNVIMHLNREASDRIDEEIQRERFLTGSSADYAFICYINGSINDVSGFRCDETIGSIFNGISPQLPPTKRFDQLFRTIVPAKDFSKFLEDVKREKITDLLKDVDSYTVFVPICIHGIESIYRLRITADIKNAGNFIISLQRMDAETQAEVRMRQLIHTLSGSYIILDYIDFESDTFSRYQSARNISSDSVLEGCYSGEVQKYVSTSVVPEDRDMLLSFLDPVNVINKLSSNKSISVRFRSMRSGEPKYFEFQFINVGESQEIKRALLTLSEIDEIVKREKASHELLTETLSQLELAERRSSRDALTGVKTISAYTDFIAKLTEQLNSHDNLSFGAIICDVNDLKEVNDTFGHTAGDEYIRSSCKLICNEFKHSPVFRTGGDEFVVMLLGMDYDNRDSLLDALRQKERQAAVIERIEDGRASFASGLAVYDPASDKSIAEVLQRAEAEMYSHKSSMKH